MKKAYGDFEASIIAGADSVSVLHSLFLILFKDSEA